MSEPFTPAQLAQIRAIVREELRRFARSVAFVADDTLHRPAEDQDAVAAGPADQRLKPTGISPEGIEHSID